MNTDIGKEVNQILSKIKPLKAVTGQSNLKEDLGFDSLDLITLYFEIEKAFDIAIDDKDLEDDNLVVLNKIIAYIQTKKDRSA